MILTISIVLLVILLVIGVPVGLAFFLSALSITISTATNPFLMLSYGYSKTSSVILLTIPLFIMAGSLMNHGGIGKQIINSASRLVGTVKGGLALVGIISCAIFAAISGSAAATLASIGGIIGPTLEEKKYPMGIIASMLASAGVLGILIPPSGIMILYGWMSSTSVLACFLAGATPGIIMIILLSLVTYFLLRKDENIETFTAAELKQIIKEEKRLRKERKEPGALPALFMPILILGCIYGGVTTTTEAAALSVVYAIPIGMFVYKELTFEKLKTSFIDAAVSTGTIMLLTITIQILSRMFINENLPNKILNVLYSISDNKWIIMIMINIFMIILGMLMDDVSATLLATPILVPVVVSLGFSPVHFAAILCVNVGMGNVTPPVAPLLYFSSRILGTDLVSMIRPTAYYIFFAWIPTLILVTFIPKISLWLPILMGYNV